MNLTPQLAAAAAGAPIASISELTGSGDVLVLAPHPDDESLGMGGAIASACDSGHRVHVAIITDGAASHRKSLRYAAPRLAELRRREVEQAVTILTKGREMPIWLGYPDLSAPETEASFFEVGQRLAPILDRVSAVWTTWGGDPHPDHQRTWHLARHLAAQRYDRKLFGCPIWSRVQDMVPGFVPAGLMRFGSSNWRELKASAVSSHVSQMTGLIADDPSGFRMAPDLAAYFVDSDELFIPGGNE
ncbi:PIG-L deacetylase family protein [Frigidibacter sp. MR17.24]|uniref:PIG-L deacetylase family protein n=1 Tax=Frigidibacter sp. MR17.24 TaxID=3127345 RepID=UPI003012CC5D